MIEMRKKAQEKLFVKIRKNRMYNKVYQSIDKNMSEFTNRVNYLRTLLQNKKTSTANEDVTIVLEKADFIKEHSQKEKLKSIDKFFTRREMSQIVRLIGSKSKIDFCLKHQICMILVFITKILIDNSNTHELDVIILFKSLLSQKDSEIRTEVS